MVSASILTDETKIDFNVSNLSSDLTEMEPINLDELHYFRYKLHQ